MAVPILSRVPHPSRPHRDGWEGTPFPRPLFQLLAIPTSPQFAILSVVLEPVLSGVEGTRAWSSSTPSRNLLLRANQRRCNHHPHPIPDTRYPTTQAPFLLPSTLTGYSTRV